MDGGLDAQTIRLEGNIGSRTVGGSGIIDCYAGPECIGACIEEPFSGQFFSVKARFPMRGAALLACELAGLPWPAINLSKLKLRYRQGQRQEAGDAGCREGDVDLKDREAGARWIAACLGRPASQSSSLQGFNRHLARQGRVNAGIRLSNSATSLWPVIPTAVMMAKAINPAMRLYSIAVAPDSSRRNFPNISCSLEL